jgi:uncharacterized protein
MSGHSAEVEQSAPGRFGSGAISLAHRPSPAKDRPVPASSRELARPRARAHRRWLLLALGWTCFVLGVIGTVLPLVPTTPFMLVALWAFSSSSERFHDWLYEHRVFGPPLQRWRRERALPLWVKLVAAGSMAASFAYAALVMRAPWYTLAAMGGVMLFGIAFIARIPSRPGGGR